MPIEHCILGFYPAVAQCEFGIVHGAPHGQHTTHLLAVELLTQVNHTATLAQYLATIGSKGIDGMAHGMVFL